MLKERTKNNQKCILLVTGLIVLMALAPAALAQRVVLVDDDGAQCPGGVAVSHPQRPGSKPLIEALPSVWWDRSSLSLVGGT